MANSISFNSLPKGLIQEIFLYAGWQEMPICSLVCKKWNDCINNTYFLKRINPHYIDFCKANDVDLNSITTKKLRNVCIKTFVFSKEKILEKIDQFFNNFFFDQKVTFNCHSLSQPFHVFRLDAIIKKGETQIDFEKETKNYECFFIEEESNLKKIELECETDFSHFNKNMLTFVSHCAQLKVDYSVNCVINKSINITDLNVILDRHIKRIELEWFKENPSKAFHSITIHYKTVFKKSTFMAFFEENLYISGVGARMNVGGDERYFVDLSWEKQFPLDQTGGWNWTCKLQHISEKPIEFKIISFHQRHSLKWEIIDNDPFKNRIIEIGSNKAIYIDNLIF